MVLNACSTLYNSEMEDIQERITALLMNLLNIYNDYEVETLWKHLKGVYYGTIWYPYELYIHLYN